MVRVRRVGWFSMWAVVCAVAAACNKPSDEELFFPGGSPPQQPASPNAKSCAGRCGGMSLDESCSCDSQCQKAGGCCADFTTVCVVKYPGNGGGGGSGGSTGGAFGGGGSSGSGATASGGFGGVSSGGQGGIAGSDAGSASCADQCGSSSTDGTCWCDSACSSYGDCCTDFSAACLPGGTGVGCMAKLCATAVAGFEDSVECYCDSLCTDYGDCCSNKQDVCGM